MDSVKDFVGRLNIGRKNVVTADMPTMCQLEL